MAADERIRGLFSSGREDMIVDAAAGRQYSRSVFFSHALSAADYINEKISSDSVIAVMENSYELALLYFAVMLTDKRIVVIDPVKGADEIKGLLDDIDGTGIFADADIAALSDRHFQMQVPPVPEDIREDIRAAVTERIDARDMDAPYLVTFTSGTSGITKGVEHSLGNLFKTAFALDEKVGKHDGCFMHVMPMTYMAGILNSLIYPFAAGCSIVIAKRFSVMSARTFWDTAIKYKADLFWLSPSMLMMIDKMDRKTDGEEYCRNCSPVFLIGTAPLSKETREKFNDRYGVNVFASYGLSETLFVSVETAQSIKKSDRNCVGEILTGVEYSLTDEGEMLLGVPWMFRRYTNEDTDKYFSGGRYRTGDLVSIRDGYLYITGRCKDLIIKGGMNISPVMIEEAVNEMEHVMECAVVGAKDECGEERVCCAYVTDGGEGDTQTFEAAMKRAVIDKLGRNYSLDAVKHMKELPRNINGKVDRNVIRQSWENVKE